MKNQSQDLEERYLFESYICVKDYINTDVCFQRGKIYTGRMREDGIMEFYDDQLRPYPLLDGN